MKRPQLFGKTLFVDFLMSTTAVLLGIMMLSDVSHHKKKAEEQKAALRTDGKYAVVMTWPDGSTDDVDLYVRDPKGNIAFFQGREVGLMHLEHDDLGSKGDSAETTGGIYKVDRNEERTIIRGIVPGEYTVNVHMYTKNDAKAAKVKIVLYQLKGEDTVVLKKERILSQKGDEETAFRFTLSASGDISNINELPRRFVGRAGQNGGSQ